MSTTAKQIEAVAGELGLTKHQLRQAVPFLKAIAAAPGYDLPRLQFADWLNEQGLREEELGQRWAAKHNRHPTLPAESLNGGWWHLGGWYHNHDWLNFYKDSPICQATLPFASNYQERLVTYQLYNKIGRRGYPQACLTYCELLFLQACALQNWSEVTGEWYAPYTSYGIVNVNKGDDHDHCDLPLL